MTPRIGNRCGFTLVEVMVAVAILSFGITMIYNAFFISSDAINYASNRLNIGMWAENKMWEDRDALLRANATSLEENFGTVSFNHRSFDWQESLQPVGDRLFELTLALSWKEAARYRKQAYWAYFSL